MKTLFKKIMSFFAGKMTNNSKSGKPAITADELLNMATKENPKEIIQEIKKATEENPFTVTKYNGQYYVLLGKYQLEKPVATKTEALKLCEDTSWVRLMQVMRAVAEDVYDQRKLNETITKQQNGKIQNPAGPMKVI